MDTHDLPLPWNLDDAVLQRVIRLGDTASELHLTAPQRREYISLGIGRFAAFLAKIILTQATPESRSPVRLALISGHDTTLIPLMQLLEVYPNKVCGDPLMFCRPR